MFSPFAIYLTVAVFGILIGFLIIATTKKGKLRTPNYRALFWMGLAFLVLHFFSSFIAEREPSSVFLILGIVYLTMGLANRDKWGKIKQPVGTDQKQIVIGLSIASILAFLLGLIVYLIKLPG